MAYDYAKLSGRIVEKYKTQARFADAIGLSERSVSLKLNGKVGWTQEEMVKASQILEFPATEIPLYFFNLCVQG